MAVRVVLAVLSLVGSYYPSGAHIDASSPNLVPSFSPKIISRAVANDNVNQGVPAHSLNIWIPSNQFLLVSGRLRNIPLMIDGKLSNLLENQYIDSEFGVIPYEVNSITFAWQASYGHYKYIIGGDFANSSFSKLNVYLSVPWKGVIPSLPSDITVNIICKEETEEQIPVSLTFDVRHEDSDSRAYGFPLKIHITKLCKPELNAQCYRQCWKNGTCSTLSDDPAVTCNTSICFPRCQHGGVCVAPGRCQCRNGYIGPHCEGGICRRACQNGGKCVQKDKCECSKGYYGEYCQNSRCMIPCQHGGWCVGVNQCRCPLAFSGSRCQKRHLRRSAAHKEKGLGRAKASQSIKRVPCGLGRRCRRRVCAGGKCRCRRCRIHRHQRKCRH